jgi:hypothetical protein
MRCADARVSSLFPEIPLPRLLVEESLLDRFSGI